MAFKQAVARGLKDPSFRVIQNHFAISGILGETVAKVCSLRKLILEQKCVISGLVNGNNIFLSLYIYEDSSFMKTALILVILML